MAKNSQKRRISQRVSFCPQVHSLPPAEQRRRSEPHRGGLLHPPGRERRRRRLPRDDAGRGRRVPPDRQVRRLRLWRFSRAQGPPDPGGQGGQDQRGRRPPALPLGPLRARVRPGREGKSSTLAAPCKIFKIASFQICETSLGLARTHAAQTGTNRFATFFANATTLEVDCGGSRRHERVPLQGFNMVDLKEGCTASTPTLIMAASDTTFNAVRQAGLFF